MNVNSLLRKSLVEYIPEAQLHSDGTYRCACPIHNGDNPTSFTIFPQENTFHCFSCGAHGNIINFVMERDSVCFDTAVKTLCDDFGVEIDDPKYKEQLDITQRNARWAVGMQRQLPRIIDYLHKRGLTDESIKTFGLGYSEKLQALSIPMYDTWGRCVAFLYRYFDQMPKYKNSKNIDGLFVKGKFLYGLPQAQRYLRKTKTLMLCEGAMDAISAIQQENCCVAYCGISVGKAHIEQIKEVIKPIGAKVVLCPDNDGKAGKFVLRARDLFMKQAPDTVVKVAVIPDGAKDFNDMLVQGMNIANDCKYESVDLYCVKQIVANEPDRDMQEKQVVAFMCTVRNPLTRADIAEYLAGVWERDVSLVRELFSIKQDTAEEQIKDIMTVDVGYQRLEHKKVEETFGVGFDNIDNTIQFTRKNVVILGAYSGSGKTTMLAEWILHWCIKCHKKVLFFSLEMPVEDIMKILISKIVQIQQFKVYEYIKERPDTYELIMDALKKYLFIVDKNYLSFDDMGNYIKLLASRDIMVDIVAVDYFQYMQGTDTLEGQENTAKNMKAFAKENNVTLFMLSQLNKGSQKDGSGKFREPVQTDLMGSGAIGNSGDYVVAIWRPAQVPGLSPIDREHVKYDTMFKIIKAREVRSGDIIFNLVYNPDTSRLVEKIGETV